jgi:hypothetical protein
MNRFMLKMSAIAVTTDSYGKLKEEVVEWFRNLAGTDPARWPEYTKYTELSKSIRAYEETLPLPDFSTMTGFSSCNQFRIVMKKIMRDIKFGWHGYNESYDEIDDMFLNADEAYLKLYIWGERTADCLWLCDEDRIAQVETVLDKVKEFTTVLNLVRSTFPLMKIRLDEINESGSKMMFIYFPMDCSCELCK